ncbi:hypothetical protein [Burkholderia anthina]|uniref:hypothetical protein n=1 Tax=Burkholderia anthina TaxID=179879 RepID=UPI00158BD6E7|nr:hypothetical protein [Burkholderia anthina]
MTEEQKKLEALKADAFAKLREAEKAMYAYFCECPVGRERCVAHDMYEEIRTLPRRHWV